MHRAERFGAIARVVEAFVVAWRRLEFSLAASLAFAAGVVAFIAAAVVFSGVTEDVTRHNGASITDSPHLHWFIAHRSPAIDTVARVLTSAGSPAVLITVAFVAAGMLWWRGQKLAIAVAPPAALAIAAASAAFLKIVVGRNRPPLAFRLVAESDASFPSGHATDTTAVLVTVALVTAVYVLRRVILRVLVVAVSGLFAGAVGLSRLVLGVHWPTDIVAGWALGAAVALLVTLLASVLSRAIPAGPSGGHDPLRQRLYES